MTCNCKETMTAQLLETVKRNLPDSKNHIVSLEGGYSTVINKETFNLSSRGSMTIEIRHTTTNKKTGNTLDKKIKETLLFTYCPFCGVRYIEEKAKALEATQ